MAQNLDHMLFAVNVKPPEIADITIPTNNLYRLIRRYKFCFGLYYKLCRLEMTSSKGYVGT